MTEFVSEIKTIPYNQEAVYKVLSDLSNLERMRDQIPQDKITDFFFETDSCSFSVNPVGNVKFSIIERNPFDTIKFVSEKLPVEIFMWIQLKASGESETKMKLTVKAQLSPFLKPMVSKPLQEGVDKIANILAAVTY